MDGHRDSNVDDATELLNIEELFGKGTMSSMVRLGSTESMIAPNQASSMMRPSFSLRSSSSSMN